MAPQETWRFVAATPGAAQSALMPAGSLSASASEKHTFASFE